MPTNFLWSPKGVNSDWSNPANWATLTNGQNPQSLVPASTDSARFGAGTSGPVNGGADAARENFAANVQFESSSGPWTLTGFLGAAQFVSLASLTINGNVRATTLANLFGGDTTINGALDATGATIQATAVGGAVVTAQGGATVKAASTGIGFGSASSGTLTITGLNTTWTDTGSSVIGAADNTGNGGTGVLTVSSSAVLTDAGSATIANATGSVGSATVTSGASWTIGTNLAVGVSGQGTLTADAARVSATGQLLVGFNAGGADAVTVRNAATLTAGSAFVGVNAGSTGAVSINSGSTFTVGTDLSVGNSGQGTLTADAARVSVTGQVQVGVTTGGVGALTVQNAATLTASSAVVGANAGATGALRVEGAGSALNDSGFLAVGSNGTGTLDVTGAIVTVGNAIQVGSGNGANGRATIGAGGTIQATGSRLSTYRLGLGIGAGSGTLDVQGFGASLSTNGEAISVGNGAGGKGQLNISGGGSVAIGALTTGIAYAAAIGDNSNATGTIAITGINSVLQAAGTIYDGLAGTGTLSVMNGGSVSATSLVLGSNSGATGVATVAGGRIDVAQTLLIGNLGTADLTIGGLGTVAAAGVTLGGNGRIDLDAGVLSGTGASTPAAILINAGGTIAGNGLITGSIINQGGAIAATDRTLTISGTVSGTGTGNRLTVGTGATLVLGGAIDNSQTIVFADATGIVMTPAPGMFAAHVANFQQGDTIDLANITVASTLLQNGVLTLFDGANARVGQITFDGGYVSTVSVQFGTGTTTTPLAITTSVMPCFVAGALIRTDRGQVPVEAVRVGDRVAVAGGGVRPVVWVGRRHVAITDHARPDEVSPIRIRGEAFAPGQPARDLLLSPDHAVFTRGRLIPVKYLVNGDSVTRSAMTECVYVHIELDRHDVILAEGLPVESYLDTGDRHRFGDAPDPAAREPGFASREREAASCAPLLVAGPELDAARRFLQDRARAASLANIARGDKLAAD